MAKEKLEKLPFEAALEQLESLLESLESGEIALDELVSRYEQGSVLLKVCQDHLEKAEMRVEKLKTREGVLETEPLDDSSA